MSTIKTLLIGIGVGTVLGILYAPAKGEETRRKLARRGNDLRDRFNDLKDSINEKLDDFRDNVNEMAYEELEKIEAEQGTDASSAGRTSWQS